MSDKSKIEWTEATWNPLRGCSKVSPGCEHCYAMHVAARFSGPGQPYEGLAKREPVNWTGQVRVVEEKLDEPLRWQRPRRIFVNSMSDLFHEAVHNEVVERIFAIMYLASQHTFQVLTKRAERMQVWCAWGHTPARVTWQVHELCKALAIVPPAELFDGQGYSTVPVPWPLPNVWLGVSVEDQERADERLSWLVNTPAAVRWISAEPLLGPVELQLASSPSPPAPLPQGGEGRVDWVVVGGESGHNARPMHPDWARALRDQCCASRVPFFFKQWGEWAPNEVAAAPARPWTPCGPERVYVWHDRDEVSLKIGKHAAGRLLDGVLHEEYPAAAVDAIGH